jgi:dUTP pyrophosphatase
MTVLSKTDIQRLIRAVPPLVENYLDLESQLQPNGIDVTVRDIARLQSSGTIAVDNANRQLSSLTPLEFDRQGYVDLTSGPYLITLNEIVNLPNNVMALSRPRSSLLRCGVTIETAVWDAGYSGRSQSLLVVHNSSGFRLQRNSRVLQLIFFFLTGETEGYKGKYQRENI